MKAKGVVVVLEDTSTAIFIRSSKATGNDKCVAPSPS